MKIAIILLTGHAVFNCPQRFCLIPAQRVHILRDYNRPLNRYTMMKLKVVIIDDELNSLNVLKMLIEQYCPDVEVIGEANDARAGKKMIDECSPDIVFLGYRNAAGLGIRLAG